MTSEGRVFLSAQEIEPIARRLMSRSRSDACEIAISGGEEQNLRFAHGAATTNRSLADVSLRVSSHIERRVAFVEIASLDEHAALRALERSEQIVRALPPDADYVPPLGPQHYEASRRYDEKTGTLDMRALAAHAGAAIALGERRGVETFGCAASGRRFMAIVNSAGLFAYDRRAEIEISVTARNSADNWSGWAGENAIRADALDAGEVARRACEKAAYDETPRDIEPGRHLVIFEPQATAELARWLLRALDARATEEGRGYFGGKRAGERLFDAKLTLSSDPADPLAPESPIGFEGLARRARSWIDKGVVVSFYRDRAYARKTGAEAVAHPRGFRVAGGDTPIEEMIRATKSGLLVTRLWYANMLDPRSLLLTGLTRDGNFVIENGKVVAPARNMRFNASLAAVFANIGALGPSRRAWSAFADGAAASAPAMLVEGFPFTSRSAGI
jgi:predicted Zn-dependent protease